MILHTKQTGAHEMTSLPMIKVAEPHPAAVCLLPATNPDDGAKLSALPHVEALFERLRFKGCFADGDGCACLARHKLCDEMRVLLDLPAGTPGLDDACGFSCAKPLTAAGAPYHGSRAPPLSRPAAGTIHPHLCSCGVSSPHRECLRLH